MRAVNLYREQGPKVLFDSGAGRSGGVLKGATHQQVQALLDAGQSVSEIGRLSGVLPNTLHKAIRQGRLHRARGNTSATTEHLRAVRVSAAQPEASLRWLCHQAQRGSGGDGDAGFCADPIRNGARRTPALKRKGGVLLANGLLRYSGELYAWPKGFYGLASIFLLLALMALARIKSIEQLRYVAPGEWGHWP